MGRSPVRATGNDCRCRHGLYSGALYRCAGHDERQIEGAVSSSDASTEKLKSLGITVFDLNEVDRLGIYVDGADEINGHMQMIKGGGAALTREKIIFCCG
jgi:ribose 5-phosphate isomerase